MAAITLWRKLVEVTWEQSSRLERSDVEAWGADNPLRAPLLACLDSGEDADLVLTPALTSALYEDLGWKEREVMATRIEDADVDVEA